MGEIEEREEYIIGLNIQLATSPEDLLEETYVITITTDVGTIIEAVAKGKQEAIKYQIGNKVKVSL